MENRIIETEENLEIYSRFSSVSFMFFKFARKGEKHETKRDGSNSN